MIELKNVSKFYNNNGVVTLGLRNINLNFDKNEIVAIVGESGSGKSTLLNVICGVDSFEEGEILFNGYETSYFNQEDMDTFRRKNVSFIYQNYNIIDSYTVLENVMFPLLINGASKKEAKERALELIENVGLKHRANHRGTRLSGGEKQRCVIARALATDAPILACDEPTGNLDSKTGADIINLIKEVASDKLVLIVTHNYEQVEGIVTRTIKMSDGEVVSDTNVNNNFTEEAKDGDIFTDGSKNVKYSTLASIGVNNLLSTPKKNIFILMVLLVLSIIGLFLFGNSYANSQEAQFQSFNGFSNTVRDRIIVYNKEHKSFDPNTFDGYEKYVNAYYEDYSATIRYEEKKDYYFSFDEEVVITAHVPSNLTNKTGKTNLSGNECYLIFGSSSYSSYYVSEVYEKELKLYFGDSSYNVNLVGYANSSETTKSILVLSSDYLSSIKTYAPSYKYGTAKINDSDGSITIKYSDQITRPQLSYTKGTITSISDIKIESQKNVYSYTITRVDYDVVEANDIVQTTLTLPNRYFDKECYELTIYTNNMNKVQKLANDNNLSYIIPSKAGARILTYSFILFVFSVLYASLIMIFLVFISYTVLQKVYQSRRKDYAIMRSLGMMKNQMAKIIRFEVLTLGLIASVLSILILMVIGASTSAPIKAVEAVFTPWFIVLYLVLMFLFDLRLANKFNKKLFKFSVTKTIKEVF